MSTTNDPTVLDLRDTDHALDPHWLDENIDRGEQSLRRIPPRYATSVADNPTVRDWASQLITTAAERAGNTQPPKITRGPSLLLLGPVGTGKTHQAFGVIRALGRSGVACAWTVATAAEIYASMRPRHGVDPEAVFEKYAHAGLLVIDDLGAAKSSEWVEEINYRLVNERYEHERPTIVTSNLTPKDLGSGLGERVASRLVEMCTRVVLDGRDRRRAA